MGKEAAPQWITDRLKRSPVRRERQRYFKDLTTFARASKVQFSVGYLAELACYTRIPTALYNSLKKKGVDLPTLETEYYQFQKECRKDFGDEFILPYLDELSEYLEVTGRDCSTLEKVRHYLNFTRSEWSKGLCIQPATFYRIETGKAKELPEAVVQALFHAGVPSNLIKEWNERARHYSTA